MSFRRWLLGPTLLFAFAACGPSKRSPSTLEVGDTGAPRIEAAASVSPASIPPEIEQHLRELEDLSTRNAAEAWFLAQGETTHDVLAAHADRFWVTVVLGKLGRKKDLAVLERLVVDAPNMDGSWAAAMALAEHGDPEAEASLGRLLNGQQPRAIGNALSAIGIRKAERLRADVERMLRHESPDVRRRAVLALGRLGPGPSEAVLRAMRTTERDVDVLDAIDSLAP